ncbi:3,4-dehydroadipyl-CoA semialdehyde dehydrogenase [Undibacterium sp.]|jgi:3,4-dehydroadipyl-CoA semialdehyde dehydrogenase|uniref:3,4-dehydroadipyl-CoA semialdehyde dehydrogenase n=1 Tax=Undibacterium sp. TaxID=1914977 RepID=UPI002CC7BA2D|nr:3,4-dehydroadipyl-CoA semialdehyde dehydrogenase [Undibacterium sp.]HTD04550.1 3,4-dehydroadipyl-CoA semialdehyde dehydrogenase [Undibacterium sp.]
MNNYLHNYLGAQWQAPADAVNVLRDPITGLQVASAGGQAAQLQSGFEFARTQGAAALQAMSYGERAAMLDQVLKVLQANRDAYYDISLANSGTTKADSAVDIEGACFTLGYYARLGAGLGDARVLLDGAPAIYSKDKLFQSQHILAPVRGVALFINAFNFPAWGLWEKAAPALLSGVPVIVKPATVTAWLTHRMVADVIAAGILPPGALSIVCGSSGGLLDQLKPFDVLSFTGSADTAVAIRSHDAVARHSVRVNIEADSLNCSILGPDAIPGSASFDSYVNELVREMSTKSGQRCTAIRRALVPASCFHQVAEAVSARLAQIKVGNPRNEEVRMGSLVSREQYEHVQAGIRLLAGEASVLYDGARQALVDADPAVAACIAPTLFGIEDADRATLVHDHEVFGPVSTLLGYRDTGHAIALAHRGLGSLVASAFSEDAAWLASTAQALASSHGRVHTVTPEVAKTQSGHGNVMPGSIHGGPGRAGGGEELGGLRGLAFYHRRSAIQGSAQTLENLSAAATAWAV